MFVSLLRKLISHPFGGNEREVAVRLRNNLRKFAKLATHVEKIAKRFAAEIAACNRPVQTCSVPVQLREFSSNLVSTNLLNVRWAYWLYFSRWWLEQWLASLSEWSGSPRSRLVESGGGTNFLENVLERWKNAGECLQSNSKSTMKHHDGTVMIFIFFLSLQ